MNIIIVGIGNVGLELLEQLSKEGHSIVVVDSDTQVVEHAVNTYDIKGVAGGGASYEVLTEAGVSFCDVMIACTEKDETNILCCLVAKKLGAKETIARVRSPEYFTLFNGKELGLSMMVNPEYETAMEIARILRFPSAITIEPFADGKVDLVELKVSPESPLIGLVLRDFAQKFKAQVLICAIERDGRVIIPTGASTIEVEDKVYITASAKNISVFFKELGLARGSKNAMLVGGGRIAYYLARELDKIGTNVKIIERDEEKCTRLAESLDKTEVIWGDGTDQEVLLDEGMLHANAFVALCGLDEQNIIISLFANSKKVNKIIAKVDKSTYYTMLEGSGIDSIVSTKKSTANQIIRYVRAKQNSVGSTFSKLYRIVGEQAEALEFTVTDSFKGIGVPLKEMKLRDNLLVAGIQRENEFVTPNGNDILEIGDSVIIVTTNEFLDELNDILE